MLVEVVCDLKVMFDLCVVVGMLEVVGVIMLWCLFYFVLEVFDYDECKCLCWIGVMIGMFDLFDLWLLKFEFVCW